MINILIGGDSMRTEHLQYLLEVIRCGSINKASQKLFLSQQQLSKIISSLEEEFHTPILVRTSKGILVTPEGKLIVEKICPLLDEISALQKDFSAKSTPNIEGTICIYKEPSIVSDMFAQLIHEILTIQPGIHIKVIESYFCNTLLALEKDEAQIGIVHLLEQQQALIPDKFEFIPVLLRVPAVYAATNSNFCRHHNSTSLKALLNEPLIDYSISNQDNDFLNSLFHAIGTPQIKSSIGNLNSLLDILKEGNFLYIGSSPAKHHPVIPDITVVPIRDKLPIIQGLILPKEFESNPLIQFFLQKYLSFFEKFR